MTSEPRDVGPMYGGDQPATEEDRTQVLFLLKVAARDGRITQDELAQRTAIAQQAQTFDDLIPITRDLMTGPWQRPSAGLQRVSSSVPAIAGEAPHWAVSVLGTTRRRGRWTVPPRINVVAVLGSTKLDFRDAVWSTPVCEIWVGASLGDVHITVPDGVEVQNQTFALLGDAKTERVNAAPPGSPLIVVKGIALLGGVQVTGAG